MHRALEIRDLLDEILSWLDNRHLAATIRVNREWFNASKPLLWKTINFFNALQILGPTELLDNRLYRRIRYTSIRKWRRFVLYSRHVHTLYVSRAETLVLVWHPSILEELNISGKEYFFPNCRLLKWQVILPSLAFTPNVLDRLIPPALNHIYLTGDCLDVDAFRNFCQGLADRLTNLRVLHIDNNAFDSQTLDFSDPFDLLLTKFASTLTHVRISEFLLTEITIGKLFALPSLREIRAHHRSGYQYHDMEYRTEHTGHGIAGSFGTGSLKYISFGALAYQPPVVNLFRQFSLSALTVLRWYFSQAHFPVDIFSATIVHSCPNLETLDLGTRDRRLNHEANISCEWSSVRTLLSCKKLTSLVLRCVRVEMTLDNFVELLSSREGSLDWRVIEIFGIQPFHLQEALLLVAKYSPKIHGLGLHLHVENGVQPFSDIPAMSLPLPLANSDSVDIQAYIETYSFWINHFRETGFFLPCLSSLNFGHSRFVSPRPAIGPIASLLLAICKNPVYLSGYELGFFDKIDEHMVVYYTEVAKLTDQPMSDEVRQFLLRQEEASSDFSDSDESSDTDVELW